MYQITGIIKSVAAINMILRCALDVRESKMQAEMTEIVMPGDTNHLGTCFGGKIMSWIDMVAAIAAQRGVGSVVTASVDSVQFQHPIKLGDVVTLKSRVNRVWNTSLEVGVTVLVQRHEEDAIIVPDRDVQTYQKLGNPQQVCKAYLTFVAVTDDGKRREIGEHGMGLMCAPDYRRWHAADERRKIRLANRRK
jgi:acyl-CoA hydrolase